MTNIYTKKVLDHFRNPRNMGEIEDADGIGTVGNPVCVLPDTDIVSNPISTPISRLNLGNRVLSQDGKFYEVNRKFKREYHGKVLMIQNRLGKTFLTPDHLIYAFRVPKPQYYSYNRNERRLSDYVSWWHSIDLEKNDIIIYPISRDEEDVDHIDVKSEESKDDSKSTSIPSKIKINKDFIRFAGYFLSEGNIGTQKHKTYTRLTFDISKEKYIKDCINLIEKVFSLKVKTEKIPETKTSEIIIYNTYLTRFLGDLFSTETEEKKIPKFMMFLPIKKQAELIKGLWHGNGKTDEERSKTSYSTISKQLSQQIKILLLRQGIIPSIYERESESKVNHRKTYRISVFEKNSLRKLASILKVNFNFRDKTSCNAWIEKGFLFTPITKIEEIKYNGPVYNLEVDKAHSYTTNSLLIHNCGDVMTIYIKVKDDRISDIKFKTYGCVAAVASSSITTELVKGKTLDEALKLTRNDVAEELGGLPAVKMHCSNLAADALREAIKDYKNKQKE